MKKIAVLLLLGVILSLAAVSVVYAAWEQHVTVTGTVHTADP